MSPRSVLRGKLGRRGAAVDVDVKDSDRQTEDGNASLEKLFVEMEEHMALDRIIEARAVVDRIRSSPFYVSSSRVSPQRERRILHIVRESDHITDMLRDLQTDDGWTFANERRGVTVHYRHHDGSAVHTVKTHTILENYGPKEFLYLISLFLEADLMWKWFPNKVGCRIREFTVSRKMPRWAHPITHLIYLRCDPRSFKASNSSPSLRNITRFCFHTSTYIYQWSPIERC